MEIDLGRVLDALPAMVWTALPAGQIDFINRRWSEYTGLDIGKAHGLEWQAVVDPDDLPELLERWRSILASGEPGEMEARVRRFDGQYRWFLVKCSPMRDDAGRIVKWCGVNTDIEDRKRAEEALSASEHYSRLIVDSIPGQVAIFAPSGEVELVNQRTLDYYGMTLEELKGSASGDAIHPEDRPCANELFAQLIATGEPFEVETRNRRSDGVYRWFQSRVHPLRDPNGRIARWYGLLVDIDDSKRAETNLAREKQLLEMIASGSPLRDVLTTLCKMIEDAAPGCYCGVHPIDWRSQTFEYGLEPSLPASYSDPIAGLSVSGDLLPCGIAAHEKIQVIAEDIESDPRWHSSFVRTHVLEHGLRSVWSTPICSKQGHVLGTFCIVQRNPAIPSMHHQNLISHATHIASIAIERSRTETALRRSETLLEEGQRLSSTGAFSWRVDTDEVAFSRELYRIFEFDPTFLVTLERIRERIHPEDIPLLSAQMARVRAGLGYLGYEIRLRMPDGSVKYLRTFGRVVRHQDDQMECLAAVQDVTERRLADEALGKARSELAHVARVTSLGALTASIAHEVNQPLSGIITNAGTCLRMLAADPPNIGVAQETARRTIRDGNRAADVIARLRSLFSRKTPRIEPIDLNEAAREVVALSSGELLRSRVVLRTELEDGLPRVGGDRIQLQQVILNLLRNAADAMSSVDERPRQVMIRTESDEHGQVRLSVEDAGVGFGPDGPERLFEAFYTTKSDGMGIGLSVSRSIIEAHKGRLWAQANDGPGATFSFSLPDYSGNENPVQQADAFQLPVTNNAQSPAEIS